MRIGTRNLAHVRPGDRFIEGSNCFTDRDLFSYTERCTYENSIQFHFTCHEVEKSKGQTKTTMITGMFRELRERYVGRFTVTKW